MAVDLRGGGRQPEMLTGLQFERAEGREEQMDGLGHVQVDAGGFPSGAI